MALFKLIRMGVAAAMIAGVSAPHFLRRRLSKPPSPVALPVVIAQLWCALFSLTFLLPGVPQ
ncbi:hypothetical protein V6L77_18555 [Pannonibacter sp. Pt2-lr]